MQHDLWGVVGTQAGRWAALRERIAAHGLRNSLLTARRILHARNVISAPTGNVTRPTPDSDRD
ncbi:hypothetical protein [Streptosporangium sp. NPDC051022]|uniref:hypothetical protein n=1 Tax=Streptosporangium sp. NPDC051022 TaxID=3155752 RepID=UPI003438154B